MRAADTFDSSFEGLCHRVGYRLLDLEPGCEFDTVDKTFVRAVLCDAAAILAGLDKGIFAKKVEVPLQPGESCQQFPAECGEVGDILGLYDKTHKRFVPAEEAPYEAVLRDGYYPICCDSKRQRRGGPYANTPKVTIARLGSSTGDFLISPVPAHGVTSVLQVMCSEVQDWIDSDDPLPASARKYFTALTELAMYIGLSLDHDSPSAQARAAIHLEAFTSLTALSQGAARIAEQVRERRGA